MIIWPIVPVEYCWLEPKYVCPDEPNRAPLDEALKHFNPDDWEYRENAEGGDSDGDGRKEGDCKYLGECWMARRGSHHAAHEESDSRDPLMRVRTRVDAAITGVAFVVVVFEDEMPAPERSRSLHTNRGTTTDGRPFRLCEVFERPNERGRDRRSEEAKSKPTRVGFDPRPSTSVQESSHRIGCSPKKVDKVQDIRKDGTPRIRRDVRTDEMSINARGGERRSEEAKSKLQRCSFDPRPSMSPQKTADRIGCSSKKVHKIRKIRKHGIPEIRTAVRLVRQARGRDGDRHTEKARSMPQRCGIDQGRCGSAQSTAKQIGCHFRTVEKIREKLKDATPEIRRALRTDKMSINTASTLILEMENAK